MEGKKVRQELSLEDKKKALAQSGIILGAILLLCYFFGFSYIWNTSYGTEASVNGWNYIIACITWNFKGTNGVYGKWLAVPFNWYAKYYVRILAVGTTVNLLILLSYIVVSCFNIKKYRHKLEVASMILLYVLAISYLFCLVVALAMNGSNILPKYCDNNPKCSIATLVFIPFFLTVIAAIVHSVFLYKSIEEE